MIKEMYHDCGLCGWMGMVSGKWCMNCMGTGRIKITVV